MVGWLVPLSTIVKTFSRNFPTFVNFHEISRIFTNFHEISRIQGNHETRENRETFSRCFLIFLSFRDLLEIRENSEIHKNRKKSHEKFSRFSWISAIFLKRFHAFTDVGANFLHSYFHASLTVSFRLFF